LSRTHATSYCETAAVLLEFANDAVSGLPAYTFPAWPAALNGEPVAVAELPGVTGLSGPQVFAGAPGWPVVGLTCAATGRAVATLAKPTKIAIAMGFRMAVLLSTGRMGVVPVD